MKKLGIVLGIFVLVVAVLRRIGPTLAEQAMRRCQEMVADRSPRGQRSVEERQRLASSVGGR
jgi:hypothetical protein